MLGRYIARRLTRNMRNYCFVSIKSDAVKKELNLCKQLRGKIKSAGPITVADYMKEVLVNPIGGYYMHKDVFGHEGDFITSPEISQIFGEMIAIWFLNEWSKCGSPRPFQIVELGPGRGTLCQDILRVMDQFKALKGVEVNLVEVSPLLSDLQSRRLCFNSNHSPKEVVYRDGIAMQGNPIRWYRHLDDVPKGVFTLLVAHEFFDALPIHKFEKTDKGYRELLVDIDPENDSKFRLIISNEETAMQKIFTATNDPRQHIEISPESILTVQNIARRVEQDGGLALLADYGHVGDKSDTFRAFRKHKLHDPLLEPGTADLTADVNFSDLKKAAENGHEVLVFGPVTQREFLLRLECELRYKRLLELSESQHDSKELKQQLESSYKMMTDKDQMGDRFKFMAIVPKSIESIIKKYPLIGFDSS